MVVTRFYSLDEQPGLVRKVSDFAEQLASGDGGSKERTCGFLPFRGNGSAEADFARILQTMIGKTLNPGENQSAMSSIMSRIRIFEDSTCNFDLGNGERATFTECRSTQFRRLRALASVPEEHYVASMCSKPFKGQSGQGGKSGALFLKTHDERYIVKTIADHEFDCLRDILPNYLMYLEENRASLLSRFYGAYALTIGHSTLRVVVMGNCLMGAQSQVYDLKGTTEDRWVDPVQHSVLKDTNFSPYTILLEAGRVDQLRRVIQDDAEFLECCGLMDYSLLVGVASSADASVDGAGGGADVIESVARRRRWLAPFGGGAESPAAVPARHYRLPPAVDTQEGGGSLVEKAYNWLHAGDRH